MFIKKRRMYSQNLVLRLYDRDQNSTNLLSFGFEKMFSFSGFLECSSSSCTKYNEKHLIFLAFKELKGQHRTPLSLSLFRALFHSSQVHKTCGASSNSFISLTSARRFTHSALEEEIEAAERKLNNNNNNNNNNTGDEQINRA